MHRPFAGLWRAGARYAAHPLSTRVPCRRDLAQVSGSDQPVLLADAITTTDAQRERMAEILFEKQQAPALFFAYQPVLAVYSCGRVSSIILDAGSGVTHAMAVHEGFAFPHTIKRLELGGADVGHGAGAGVVMPLQRGAGGLCVCI